MGCKDTVMDATLSQPDTESHTWPCSGGRGPDFEPLWQWETCPFFDTTLKSRISGRWWDMLF
eukprot:1142385-Pelagomonas_calceolata.AAC.2